MARGESYAPGTARPLPMWPCSAVAGCVLLASPLTEVHRATGPWGLGDMDIRLSASERRALGTLLPTVTAIAVLVLVLLILAAIQYFLDIVVIFFLAWLVAFLIDPFASALTQRFPRLPRGGAAVIVFVVTVGVVLGTVAWVGVSLAASIEEYVNQAGTIDAAVSRLIGPIQTQLDQLGLGGIDLQGIINGIVLETRAQAATLAAEFATAGATLLASTITVAFIAVALVAEKSRWLEAVARLVPAAQWPRYREFSRATTRAFGGFVRGQFIVGVVEGIITFAVASAVGLPFAPLIALVAGILQVIPFFGQLVSWVPGVAVAMILRPEVLLPMLVLQVGGALLLQNVIQPRVIGRAIGLDPVLVLAAVFVGARLAGPVGAVFGVPILAIVVSLVASWLDASRASAEPAEHAAGEPAAVRREAALPAGAATDFASLSVPGLPAVPSGVERFSSQLADTEEPSELEEPR